MIPICLAGFHQTRRFEEKWKPIVEHHGYPQSYKLLYYNYTKEECSKLGGWRYPNCRFEHETARFIFCSLSITAVYPIATINCEQARASGLRMRSRSLDSATGRDRAVSEELSVCNCKTKTRICSPHTLHHKPCYATPSSRSLTFEACILGLASCDS